MVNVTLLILFFQHHAICDWLLNVNAKSKSFTWHLDLLHFLPFAVAISE